MKSILQSSETSCLKLDVGMIDIQNSIEVCYVFSHYSLNKLKTFKKSIQRHFAYGLTINYYSLKMKAIDSRNRSLLLIFIKFVIEFYSSPIQQFFEKQHRSRYFQ